jgi:two-component system, NarL family, sensor histidine kinase FusK
LLGQQPRTAPGDDAISLTTRGHLVDTHLVHVSRADRWAGSPPAQRHSGDGIGLALKARGDDAGRNAAVGYPIVRSLIMVVAVAGVYFGAAKLGLSAAFATEQVSAVWPPTGIALAALVLLGVRVWPGIYLGALLANADTAEPLAAAAGIAAGNTLMTLVCLVVLRRIVRFDPALERTRDVFGLAAAAVLSAAVSASNGVANLALHGLVSWATFGSVWGVWWVGDAMGIVIVAPILLVWASRPLPRWRGRRVLEGATVFLALALVSAVTLCDDAAASFGTQLKYVIFPFLMWTALRFGPRGSASAVLLVSGVAVWGTLGGRGPFVAGSLDERVSSSWSCSWRRRR